MWDTGEEWEEWEEWGVPGVTSEAQQTTECKSE